MNRISKLKYFSEESHIAKKFYIFLFAIEFVRMVSFILVCIMYYFGITKEQMNAIKGALTGSTINEEINLIPKPLFLFMIVPDFLVIIAFLILFWQLLSIYYDGHANLFKVMG